MSDCRYCRHDKQVCLANSPKFQNKGMSLGYHCGRARGHKGPHVACLYGDRHAAAMWPKRKRNKVGGAV